MIPSFLRIRVKLITFRSLAPVYTTTIIMCMLLVWLRDKTSLKLKVLLVFIGKRVKLQCATPLYDVEMHESFNLTKFMKKKFHNCSFPSNCRLWTQEFEKQSCCNPFKRWCQIFIENNTRFELTSRVICNHNLFWHIHAENKEFYKCYFDSYYCTGLFWR